jgi:polyisoprenoid-binding protein YceI
MQRNPRQVYAIDPQHSSVEFSVKHMGVGRVRGRFRGISGALHLDELQPEASWVRATIDAGSIDTGVEERDAHLRSADFLNVALFPQILYQNTRLERRDETRWRVDGEMTIRGITRTPRHGSDA